MCSRTVGEMDHQQSIGNLPVLIDHKNISVVPLDRLWKYLLQINTPPLPDFRIRDALLEFSHEEMGLGRRLGDRDDQNFWRSLTIKVARKFIRLLILQNFLIVRKDNCLILNASAFQSLGD